MQDDMSCILKLLSIGVIIRKNKCIGRSIKMGRSGRGQGSGSGRGQGRGQGRGMGPGRMGGTGDGPGGNCVCTACGHKVPHPLGQPCNRMKCPKCGAVMTREM